MTPATPHLLSLRNREPVAVAVSGGMDSLLALALLREQGREVLAVHARLSVEDESGDGSELARRCEWIGADLHVVDLMQDFEDLVVTPFVESYARGLTPNPCAICNPRLKFGRLMDHALSLGAGSFATGHYARIALRTGEPALVRAADPSKDQSYFLALVRRARLTHMTFPLAGIFKKDIPRMLAERGIEPPAQAESQEICFVPEDDYAAFLERRGRDSVLALPGPGPVVLADGREIGRHKGLWRHTIGQRRGLGIAWNEPLYVLAKDSTANRLVVGPRADTLASGCVTRPANLLAEPETWPPEVLVKVRYRQKAVPAHWEILPDGGLRVLFRELDERPAPGQIAVLYDSAGMVLAGGIIRDAISRDCQVLGPRLW